MTENKRFNCHVKFSEMPNGIMVLDYTKKGKEQTVIEDISREKAHRVRDRLNELSDENEQLKSVNQELRNELKFDEKMYKTFKEIIDEADDLITSHLSKHYQRQWKNFCKHRGVLDD